MVEKKCWIQLFIVIYYVHIRLVSIVKYCKICINRIENQTYKAFMNIPL